MSKLYRFARRLKYQWASGAAILLVIAASAVPIGLVGAVVLGPLGGLLGIDLDSWEWIGVSALIWLPIAAGAVSPALAKFDYRTLEREADQAGSATRIWPGEAK